MWPPPPPPPPHYDHQRSLLFPPKALLSTQTQTLLKTNAFGENSNPETKFAKTTKVQLQFTEKCINKTEISIKKKKKKNLLIFF